MMIDRTGRQLLGTYRKLFSGPGLPPDSAWHKDRTAQNRLRLIWLLTALMLLMIGICIQSLMDKGPISSSLQMSYVAVSGVFALIAGLYLVPAVIWYPRLNPQGRDIYALVCAGSILLCASLLTWLDSQGSMDISAWLAGTLIPPVMLRMKTRVWSLMTFCTAVVLLAILLLFPSRTQVSFNYTIFLAAPLLGLMFSRIFESGYREAWHYRTLLEQKNSELEEKTLRDGLTGIFNRRAFDEFLLHTLAGTRRTNNELCLLMIDIDHFKRINDSFGHPAGDEVIRMTARLITQATRSSDLLARYGGEEFVAILTNTGRDAGCLVAERIRCLFESTTMPEGIGTVTVSIGLAWSKQAATPAELIHLADQALYQAKKTGRNRLVVWEEGSGGCRDMTGETPDRKEHQDV